MRIHIFTLFPEMFQGPLEHSILGRATANGLLHLSLHNIRDHADDPHRTVDDYPYGGGPGMVMKPGPSVYSRRIGARGSFAWIPGSPAHSTG